MIRRAITAGAKVARDIVELVDLEARGVEDVAVLVRAVPAVPRRVAAVVRDAIVVLAEMPTRDARPWRAFRARFTALHGASARPR